MIFAGSVPLLIGASLVLAPPLMWQVIALAPLVALLGLPHGALDHRVAGALWPLRGLRDHLRFICLYLALAGFVLTFWLVWPGLALAAFLAYSALHFSDDWRCELGFWQSLPLGVSVIALPAINWQPEVALLFGFLAPGPSAFLLAGLLHWVAIAALIAAFLCLVRNFRRLPGFAVEYALLLATALITPPLVYFVIYFCGLHSPRHFIATISQLGLTLPQGLRTALPISVATLVMVAVAAGILLHLGQSFEATTLMTVFTGLACLTVPHMILVDRFRAKAASATPHPAA
jgi:Brp/Blh family beta-carotene 15,15'-monooxygenase